MNLRKLSQQFGTVKALEIMLKNNAKENEDIEQLLKVIYTNPTMICLTVEAKKGCKELMINPEDLKEKTVEEFRFKLRDHPELSEELVVLKFT